MSCPDWKALVAARAAGEEAEGWPAARRHLDGCEACRRQALALDPVLVFSLLPPVELPSDEAERMRARVSTLRRVRRLQPARAPGVSWWAAAVLALVSLLPLSGPRPVPPGVPTAAIAGTRGGDWASELAALPIVEEIESPYRQMVHWPSGNDLDVVWLVDRRLDG